MRSRSGVDQHQVTITVCMVVGCHGKAIYRNVTTRTNRGYCNAHKHMAVTQGPFASEAKCGRFVDWLDANGRS